MEAQETAWVAGLRVGERGAFNAVFDHYHPLLYPFLLRLSGRRELAEELLQETFVRLATAAPRLRPDTRLKPFLYTVARNLYRSHRRWAWLDGTRLFELASRVAGTVDTPAELAVASELSARFEAALQLLSDANREVAVLVLVQGLEPQEAAAVLGIEAEAVRQRLARARKTIASHLTPGGDR